MVLIFCADYRRWYDVFCRYVEDVRKPDMGDLFLAEADALIAAQNAVVAAQSLGLGSCYIGDITENYEYHKRLLKLPKYVVPAAMLCFGYPTVQQRNRPKPPRHPVEALVHENGYDLDKAAQMPRMLGCMKMVTMPKNPGKWGKCCLCSRKNPEKHWRTISAGSVSGSGTAILVWK